MPHFHTQGKIFMNQEDTNKLWNAFPHLYQDKDKSLMQSLIPFGFECGRGWFQLIWDLSAALEKEIMLLPEEQRSHCRAMQVKEKFGMLHYYMTSSTDKMDDLINEAEEASASICEECGKTGSERGKGWIYTACDECEEKRKKKS